MGVKGRHQFAYFVGWQERLGDKALIIGYEITVRPRFT